MLLKNIEWYYMELGIAGVISFSLSTSLLIGVTLHFLIDNGFVKLSSSFEFQLVWYIANRRFIWLGALHNSSIVFLLRFGFVVFP